jgi:glycosyltransferase involved in cell wall biosynthesis
VNEVVVVDDGGPGSAKNVVDAFGPDCQYHWQPNQGMQRARNLGVHKSSCDWIAFLDDDDIWEKQRSELILALIRSERVDFIVGDFCIFDETGIQIASFFKRHQIYFPDFWTNVKRSSSEPFKIIDRLAPESLFPSPPFWGATTAISRQKFDELGGWSTRVRNIPSEDLHFVFRAIRKCRIGLIWEPTLRYRSHEGNVSRDDTKKLLGRAEVARILLEEETLTVTQRTALTHFIELARREAAWSYFERREYGKVVDIARKVQWRDLPTSLMLKIALSYVLRKGDVSKT